jgi:hypothetical protein
MVTYGKGLIMASTIASCKSLSSCENLACNLFSICIASCLISVSKTLCISILRSFHCLHSSGKRCRSPHSTSNSKEAPSISSLRRSVPLSLRQFIPFSAMISIRIDHAQEALELYKIEIFTVEWFGGTLRGSVLRSHEALHRFSE